MRPDFEIVDDADWQPPPIPDEGGTTVPAEGEPEPTYRTVFTAKQLMDTEFPEPRYAVPGLVVEGVNLLAGSPKTGKSWLALNICHAVASGGIALGKVPVDQGKALYLALEDTGRRLQERLGAVLQGEPAPEGLTLATEWPKMSMGGGERLQRTLHDNPDLRLVVVDVLTKVRDHISGRGDRYQADYDSIVPIKKLADKYGTSFLVIHHTRKAAADDFLDTVSGTQGLSGAADAVLVLQRSRGSSDAELHVTGRDIEERSYALSTEPMWAPKMLDGPAELHRLSGTRRTIVETLRQFEEGLSPKEIADACDVSYATVRQTVTRMAGDGQLETNGDGTYTPALSLVSQLSLNGDEPQLDPPSSPI